MKRLIKSEFFNGFQDALDYQECFKNPTSKEWKEIKDTGGIRGVIINDGTVYLWASSLLHRAALRIFGIPTDGVHFDADNSSKIHLYIHNEITPEYFQKAFQNSDTLYNYFSKNTTIDVNTKYYDAKRYNIYEVNTIQKILDFNIEEIWNNDKFENFCKNCGNIRSQCNCSEPDE